MRHLHHSRVCDGKAGIALVGCVVVNHHIAHHSSVLISFLDAEDVSFDSVVECSCRNLDFLLCLADIVTQGEDLVVGERNEVV